MPHAVGPEHYPLLIALARFGAAVFEEARDELGSLDGGDLQELMQKHGLLHDVPVLAACGDECRCCEYGDFPQDCLRPVAGLPELIRALTKPPGVDPDDAPIG